MTNSVMASGLPKVRNSRRTLYVLSYLVFFSAAGVYIFSMLQKAHYDNLIRKEQEQIAVLQKDIDIAQKDERYQKYAAAKSIVTNISMGAGRGDRLSRIMNVFERMQKVGGSNIRFSDFSIDFSSLSLKGSVSDLKLIYAKGGLVDQFNELDFLSNISIPDYKKTDDGFSFSLAADVLLQNVTK